MTAAIRRAPVLAIILASYLMIVLLDESGASRASLPMRRIENKETTMKLTVTRVRIARRSPAGTRRTRRGPPRRIRAREHKIRFCAWRKLREGVERDQLQRDGRTLPAILVLSPDPDRASGA